MYSVLKCFFTELVLFHCFKLDNVIVCVESPKCANNEMPV